MVSICPHFERPQLTVTTTKTALILAYLSISMENISAEFPQTIRRSRRKNKGNIQSLAVLADNLTLSTAPPPSGPQTLITQQAIQPAPVSSSSRDALVTPEPAPPQKHDQAAQKAKKQLNAHRKLLSNSDGVVNTLASPEDLPSLDHTVRLEDFEFLASYNWHKSRDKIVVPGCPAKWTPPRLPITIPIDNGKFFMDTNRKLSPAGSFIPFFKSLLLMRPNYNLVDVDLITDRNGLRKLLSWTLGTVKESWRIEVDFVEDTMILSRWEQNSMAMSRGQSSGYGHGIEKAFTNTANGTKNTLGHHRIVKYTLGGLRLLVRFEVDAYVDSGFESSSPGSVRNNPEMPKQTMSHTAPLPGDLNVIQAGHLVPVDSLLEIKSRGTAKTVSFSKEYMPQLYFSQTTHHYICLHKKGKVENQDSIKKRTITKEDFMEWEDARQECLQRLVALIGYVKQKMEVDGGKQFLLVCEKGDEGKKALRILRRKGKGISLPLGAREACWPRESSSMGN